MKKEQFEALPKEDKFNRVLEGQAFYFACQTPNTSGAKKFNGPVYYGGYLGLEDTEVVKAQSYGLKILEPNDAIPMKHVKIVRKLSIKEQQKNMKIEEVKPIVVDSKQKQVPDNLLVGNGSKILCKFGTYWYDNMGGGVNTQLKKVQIRELVAYLRNSNDSQLAMDDTGFSIEADGLEALLSTTTQGANTPKQDTTAEIKADELPWDTSSDSNAAAASTNTNKKLASNTVFDT